MYEVGTFDDETGSVEPCKHVSLSSGANFISIEGAPPVPPVANLDAIREQMAVQRRFEASQVKKRKTRSATRKARKTSRR